MLNNSEQAETVAPAIAAAPIPMALTETAPAEQRSGSPPAPDRQLAEPKTNTRNAGEVTLVSPFPMHAVPRVWGWMAEFRSRLVDDFGAPKNIDEFVDGWERHERIGRQSWGVIRNGDLGGVILAVQLSPMVTQVSAVFRRSFCVNNIPLLALGLALREVFAGGAHKATATLFQTSHSMISVACQLGGKKEGVFEQHTLRGGKPANLVVIALQKENFHG